MSVDAPPAVAVDPACGMTVAVEGAAAAFLKEPERYLETAAN